MSPAVRDRWRDRRAGRLRGREPVATACAAEPAEIYDPAPFGLASTAWKLVGLWREQRRLSLLGFAYAFVYSVLSLAIPVLVARAIDRAIVTHREPLAPLLALIIVLALVRAGVNFLRRYATSRVGVHIEARLRELLYNAYLRFPRAFYDRQPTGQVLSRATNDLYPVRYFIGWGMVQAIQSAMLIVGTGVLLVATNATLALWSALPLPAIAYAAWRFGRRVAPISRAVQARKGDLTDAANEAVVGIEMVQAFGREEIIQERFADRATAIRDEMIRQARVESTHLPPVFYLPSLSVAVVLLLGGRAVIDGTLTYGQLALFIQLLLQIVWPLEAMGLILDLGQRALASAGRAFAWLDEIPLLPEAPADRAVSLPAGAEVTVAFEGVHFAYPGGSEVPESVAPNIRNRSYSIGVEVTIDTEEAEGVLFAQGSRFGGHALYVKDRKLRYVYNWVGLYEQVVESTDEVPLGHVVLSASFEKEGDTMPTEGTLTLHIREQAVGDARIKTQPAKFSLAGEGLNIGHEGGEPVTDDYPGDAPWAFVGGTIHKAIIDVSGTAFVDLANEVRMAFARD